MKEQLAEKLLGLALDWNTQIATEEFGKLRYLAAAKYDGYNNFEPGRRFLESLVSWLSQFKSEEKHIAYKFISTRILYISDVQMDHLVELLYPQRIFPILLDQVAKAKDIPPYRIKQIRSSEAFSVLKRKSLFLGLSDSARMDAFRRKNALSNDQVSVSYELSDDKWKRMHEELGKWIEKSNCNSSPLFENIFLIDDFSGSGNSILRNKEGQFEGKLKKFICDALGHLRSQKELGKYCKDGGPHLFVITYLATSWARDNLRAKLSPLIEALDRPCISTCKILEPLQLIEEHHKVPQQGDESDRLFDKLLDDYYDDRIEDEHTKTGGTDVKHGYSGGGLPLVLCHNCPNNSVYLLWAQTDGSAERPGIQPLFPRISRHWEGR